MKCVSLKMFFHLADVTLVSEITVKVVSLHFFVQMLTLSPLPSCPFGFDEYVWIRELECFEEYQSQQYRKHCRMHFVTVGKISGGLFIPNGVWHTIFLL